MSPKIQTAVKVAAIGAGVVATVVVTQKVAKSVRRRVENLFPTADDLLGCSNEQPVIPISKEEEFTTS